MKTRQTSSFIQSTITPAAGTKFGYIFYQANLNLFIYATRLNVTAFCSTAPTSAEIQIIQVLVFPFPMQPLNQTTSTPNLLDSNFQPQQVSTNNTITFSLTAANSVYTVFNQIYEEWEQGTSLEALPTQNIFAQDAAFREAPYFLPSSLAICMYVGTVTTTGKITFTTNVFIDYELAGTETGRSI